MPFDRVAFLPNHPSFTLYSAIRNSQPHSELGTVLVTTRGMQWAIASACDAALDQPLVAIAWLNVHNWLHGFAFGLSTMCREQAAAAELIEQSSATPDQMACVTSLLERMERSK